MPTSTTDFVSTLVTTVESFRACASCGTLGFDAALRAVPSGQDK